MAADRSAEGAQPQIAEPTSLSSVECRAPMEEIDVGSSGDFDTFLCGFDPASHLRLDMSGVTFCDSSGLRVLIEAAMRHEHAGGSFRISETSPIVSRLLQITSLTHLLDHAPDSTG